MKQETRRNQTRNKIFKAAIAEFSTKGLDGARIDVIARKAGVNKQRIYEYFGGKENLYSAILAENCQLIIDDEEEYFAGISEQDIPNLPRLVLKRYFEFHQKNPSFWRLLAWENLNGGKFSQNLQFRSKSFEKIKNLYLQGQKNGTFKAGVSFDSFIFIITSISYFYFSNQLTMEKTLNKKFSNPEIAELIIDEALSLMGFGNP